MLKDIVQRFDGRLALNAEVVQGGTLRVGTAVELLAVTDAAAHAQPYARREGGQSNTV